VRFFTNEGDIFYLERLCDIRLAWRLDRLLKVSTMMLARAATIHLETIWLTCKSSKIIFFVELYLIQN